MIDRIVELNRKIARFWSQSHGWAPIETAELLSRSRLDWQVELSETLRLWTTPPQPPTENAKLILAWGNPGSLVEGTLKWFLSIYYQDYLNDGDAIVDRRGIVRSPDGPSLEPLRQFFRKRIWDSSDRWDSWIRKVQQRRNAIHAYQDRSLGTHEEFCETLEDYLKLLASLDAQAPYP